MRRSAVIALTVPALVLGSLVSVASFAVPGPVRAAVCDGSTDSLGDGGFETPTVTVGGFQQLAQALVPPWQTTDGAGLIEIWSNGFLGVPAAEGVQFAELNATTAGTLYQDVVSTPGATMSWTLLHRAREGTDVMQVLIGDANVADVNGATGWDFISPDLSDDTTAWGPHTGDFVVPAGQTCTRFAFRTVSTGSGSPSVGNFLDAVSFTVTIPATPTPTPTPTPRPTVTSPPTNALGTVEARTDADSLIGLAIIGLAALAGMAAFLARTRRARIRR